MKAKIQTSLTSVLVVLFFFFLPFERLLTYEISGLTLKISFIFLMLLVLFLLSEICKHRLEIEDKLILLFAFLSFVSIIWSIDQYRSLIISAIFFAVFLGFIALKKLIKKENIPYIENIIIWSGIWLSVFALWQYFADLYGFSDLTFLRDNYKKMVFGFPRPHATFLEPLYLANYLFLPFYFSINRFVKSKSFDILASASLFLVSLVFVLSLSRGAYIGLFLSLIVFFILLSKFHKHYLKKTLLPLLIVIIAVISAVLIIKFSAPKESFDLFVAHAGVADVSTGESTLDRFYLTKLAWQQFFKQPWGIGAGAFGALPDFTKKVITGDYQTVNNLYLEVLVEEGILGFLIFIFFLALLVKKLSRNIKEKSFGSLIYLAIGLAIFVQAVSFSSLYILPIWAYLALAWNQVKNKM
jgi:O-antigen ligase